MDKNAKYIGDELELFKNAKNWKSYWRTKILPFVGKTVLDVGGGQGATRIVLENINFDKYKVIEPDPTFCTAMENDFLERGLQNTSIFNGYLEEMEEELFDTILYIDVMEHIENDFEEIKLASRYLKPGGKIIVLSPAHDFLFSQFDAAIGHFRRYDIRSMKNLCPENLILDKSFYLDSAGFFLSLANKLILRSSHPNKRQIDIWDKVFVKLSKIIDPFLLYRFGKTIVGIYKK